MDARTDGEGFGKLTDQLYAAYHEGYKAPDAFRDAMWKALRDVPYDVVKANIERAIVTAGKGVPMPRPADLRGGPPPKMTSGLPSPGQLKAERDSIRRWNDLKKSDPVTFEIEWRTARAFTAMAQCEDGSEEHSEWTRRYQQWGRLRYAPRAEQESAVRTFLEQP